MRPGFLLVRAVGLEPTLLAERDFESEAGRDLARADIRGPLRSLIDIVIQARKNGGRWAIEEVLFEPDRQVLLDEVHPDQISRA